MSLIEYAETHGITGPELGYLRRYGTTDFNRTWYYVSEEMVRDDLGQPPAKDMMQNFVNRNLTKLVEGEQYCEIPRDDPVVTAYFHYSNLSNGETAPKAGNRRKYYKITGEGLKIVALMMNNPVGRQTRVYFLKIEQLAADMLREHDRAQNLELEMLRCLARTSCSLVVANAPPNHTYFLSYHFIFFFDGRSLRGHSAARGPDRV